MRTWRELLPRPLGFISDERAREGVIGPVIFGALVVTMGAMFLIYVNSVNVVEPTSTAIKAVDAPKKASEPSEGQVFLRITHEGGDPISLSSVELRLKPIGSSSWAYIPLDASQSTTIYGPSGEFSLKTTGNRQDDTLAAGHHIDLVIAEATGSCSGQYNVRIVHTPSQTYLLDTTLEVS